MKDKIVLITGANGGLGRYITDAFLKAEALVVGTSHSIDANAFSHGKFVARASDLTDCASAEALIRSIVEEFGKIDILIHTVGGFAGGKSIAETTNETFERMLTLNFRTAFYLFRSAIPLMRKSGNGRIIAIGSRAAVESSSYSAAYAASKAALVSLIKSAAAENNNSGITINAVLPETIDTPQNRINLPYADFSKWVSPEKIAETVLWLSSDAASHTNGALIPVYGRNS